LQTGEIMGMRVRVTIKDGGYYQHAGVNHPLGYLEDIRVCAGGRIMPSHIETPFLYLEGELREVFIYADSIEILRKIYCIIYYLILFKLLQ